MTHKVETIQWLNWKKKENCGGGGGHRAGTGGAWWEEQSSGVFLLMGEVSSTQMKHVLELCISLYMYCPQTAVRPRNFKT